MRSRRMERCSYSKYAASEVGGVRVGTFYSRPTDEVAWARACSPTRSCLKMEPWWWSTAVRSSERRSTAMPPPTPESGGKRTSFVRRPFFTAAVGIFRSGTPMVSAAVRAKKNACCVIAHYCA
jgi:hypothetical protein